MSDKTAKVTDDGRLVIEDDEGLALDLDAKLVAGIRRVTMVSTISPDRWHRVSLVLASGGEVQLHGISAADVQSALNEYRARP